MVGNFAAHLTRDEMAYGAQERGLNWGSIWAPDELVAYLAESGVV